MALELFLSAAAGAAAAAAATRILPRRARAQRVGASARIVAEVSSLESRKRILEKSIVRLNGGPMGLTDAQRDALLAKYQRELGEVGVRLDALEEASRHPDLGALGDGLVTIMDRRLSEIDAKFGELSAQMASAQAARAPAPRREAASAPAQAARRTAPAPGQEAGQPRAPPHKMELTTLTPVPEGAVPRPFAPLAPQGAVPRPAAPPVPPAPPAPVARPGPAPQEAAPPAPPEPVPPVPGVEIPPPPRDEELDVADDAKDEEDLAKIKRDILKTLNRLDQAEVE